jgi:hypothetical protein
MRHAIHEYVPSHASQTPSASPHHTFRKRPPPQRPLVALAALFDQDSLCSQYGAFLVELQKRLREFTVYPHVICWLNEKLRARYQPWYQGNLISGEKTVTTFCCSRSCLCHGCLRGLPKPYERPSDKLFQPSFALLGRHQ